MKLTEKVFERCEKMDALDLRDGWFAVSHHFLDEDALKSRRYYGQWHKISSGKNSVYRCLRLSPNLKKNADVTQIAIDWDAWCVLTRDGGAKRPISLSIRKAHFFEPMIFGGHPDPATRTAYQIAFLSLLLAVLSLLITLFSR